MKPAPILQVSDLSISLEKRKHKFTIIDSISFSLEKGKTLAIIGESGSGKSLTAQAIMGILPTPPFSILGDIYLQNRNLQTATNTRHRRMLSRKIAMIFQNPKASLNPVYTIEQQLSEVALSHQVLSAYDLKNKIISTLEESGFHNPELCLQLYPHQLSGGMLQRVCIAMALLCSPEILIADEPTTALDVSVQLQILTLLKKIQKNTSMGLLIITHDMGVVAEIADDVLVMYAGKMVEFSSVSKLFLNPSHPYTQALLASRPDQKTVDSISKWATIKGQPPHYTSMPEGCRYHPRCHKTKDKCKSCVPPSIDIGNNHLLQCWLYDY